MAYRGSREHISAEHVYWEGERGVEGEVLPEAQEIATLYMHAPRPISFPDLCCYCGAPAAERLDFGAGVQMEWYGWITGQRATSKVGGVLSVPYCTEHYAKALEFQKKLPTYHSVKNLAGWTLMAACMFLSLYFFLVVNPLGELIMRIIVGIFCGLMLAGGASFIFDPLFRLLAGVLLSRRLDPEVRSDLSAQMAAQGKAIKYYNDSIPYTLGFSVEYVSHGKAELSGINMCFSNPEYARKFKQANPFAFLR